MLALAAFLFVLPAAAPAATFTVTSAADTGGSACAATCTLRQAINAANAAAGADTIDFNIAGSGLHTIALTSALPAITGPVTIDGYSQPGSAANTASVGSNAALKIAIDGSALPITQSAGENGLTFSGAAPSNLRGLLIYGFRAALNGADGSAVVFSGSSANSTVRGCFIGVDPNGRKPNEGAGILVQATASGVFIGGTAAADRNLVAGNLQGGVALLSGSNLVLGNLIGVAADGISLFGNGGYGVALLGGNGNTVGGTTSSAANTIAGNSLTGVLVGPASAGNHIERNAIWGNAGLGIELSNSVGGAPDGVTANDAGDGDGGANRSQNYPVLTGAAYGGNTLFVLGTLNSSANRTFRIEFFANDQPDPSGFGEGQLYIGSTNVTTDASGNASFTVPGAPPGVKRGQTLTATATDTTTGDTSEFSAGVIIGSNTTVTNTNDSGAGSLRDAIVNANANAGADTIDFAIPGSGVHVIRLLSALPTITEAVTIDGYTQPGAAPNVLADGDDAVIAVRLDGSQLASARIGLAICASNTVVRGLAVTGFGKMAIAVGEDLNESTCLGVSGAAVEGNFVGLLPDGATIVPNPIGIGLFGTTGARVGGADPGQRNVVSGNSVVGVLVEGGSGTAIDGNAIGTDASGSAARGNTSSGILLEGGVSTIGATARNAIAYNGQAGIRVAEGTTNRLAGNDIHDNSGLGIDLCASFANCPDGVTPNDVDDADSGANNLQNFPAITALARSGSGLQISGTLDRPATAWSLTFAIGVYANTACDPAGFGEGDRYLGSFDFVSANSGVETFTSVDFPTTASLPPGTKITLTATDPSGNTSEFSPCADLDAGAQTFVVNSALDGDDGNCTAAPGGCTLREAINAANARAGADFIAFAVPGAGVHTITPSSSLPPLQGPVTIDGYTQPGASPNTLADGDDAKIMIRIDGLGAGASDVFRVCAANVRIRGFSLTNFQDPPVIIGESSPGTACPGKRDVQVDGNFIGLAPDGSAAGNFNGIDVIDAAARIGGPSPAERNVLSSNVQRGILVSSKTVADVLAILGNFIGTDPSGTLDRGNGEDGIALFADTSSIVVGGDAPNRIAFNQNGILVNSQSANAVLYGNEFFANDVLAIDDSDTVGFDGPTANDHDDADVGGNGLQNFPVLSNATQDGPVMRLTGTLDVSSGGTSANYVLAFYANSACADGARGQGETYLGHANVQLSGASQDFIVELPATAPLGSRISSTATGAAGTSEFSPCITLAPGDHIFADGFQP